MSSEEKPKHTKLVVFMCMLPIPLFFLGFASWSHGLNLGLPIAAIVIGDFLLAILLATIGVF